MSDVRILPLADRWPDSTDAPNPVVEQDDPQGQVGTYVIEPGERVPETGMTAHEGTEISVILEGESKLVANGEEYTIGPNSLVVLEPGVEHYTVNTGSDPTRLVYTILGGL